MFTPQEISQRIDSLDKVKFGGYSVRSVEELLISLSEDYATLYKENSVLKSKIKVVTEKLEESRTESDSINRALLTAQKAADELVSEAERKCARMLSDTEAKLRQRSQELQAEVEAESERVALAKRATAQFIVELEDRIQSQLSQLERIKQMNFTVPREAVVRAAATRPQTGKAPATPAPAPRTPDPKATEEPLATLIGQPLSDTSENMTQEIEKDISRILAEAVANEMSDNMGDTRVIPIVG